MPSKGDTLSLVEPQERGPPRRADHPNDEHRVATLKDHFRKNPGVFARFDPDPESATPIHVPTETAETFVR